MDERAHSLIERIYAASLDLNAWQQVVEEMSGLFDGAAVLMSFFLPGDSTQDGIVLGSDVGTIRLAQFSQIGSANYLPTNDLDGNGTVLGADVGASRLRQFSTLPAIATLDPILAIVAIDVAGARELDLDDHELRDKIFGELDRTAFPILLAHR